MSSRRRASKTTISRFQTSSVAEQLPPPGAGFTWKSLSISDASSAWVLVPQIEGVKAVFTTRVGGTSDPPLDSLNLSLKAETQFAPAGASERVSTNRARAGRAVGSRGSWSSVRQVHGARVVEARAGGLRPEADALWTRDPSLAIGVTVADCVPVLGAADGRLVCAHAGWRGIAAGVVESAIEAISAKAVVAGPAIGPCCYEVGAEVSDALQDRYGPTVAPSSGRVDLWAAVEAAAANAGVVRVYSARICTSCNPQLFYSHRRDAGATGRQGLVARLDGAS